MSSETPFVNIPLHRVWLCGFSLPLGSRSLLLHAGFDPIIIPPLQALPVLSLTQKGLRKRNSTSHEASVQPEALSKARD